MPMSTAHVYTLTDVLTSIMPTLVRHALPKDTLDALNELCASAECVAVQPYFTAKGTFVSRSGGSNGSSNSNASTSFAFQDKHRRGAGSSIGGIPKAKEEFHVTKWGAVKETAAPSLGGNSSKPKPESSEIDVLRLLLNKVSPKTVDDLRQQLVSRLAEVGSKVDEEAVHQQEERVAAMIYQVVSGSKFYSNLFAELYAHLAGQFAWIRAHFATQQAKLLESYAPFVSVSPDTDYDGFCKMNKANDARKALTTFYVSLAMLVVDDDASEGGKEVVASSREAVAQLAAHLVARIREGTSSAATRHEVEEWVGHLALLVPALPETSPARAALAEMVKWSPKEMPGWSNQALFKCMDAVDKLTKSATSKK